MSSAIQTGVSVIKRELNINGGDADSDYLRDGEIAHIIASFALPPKDSCSKNVNFESLYGICLCFPD